MNVTEFVDRFTMEEIIGAWFKDTTNPYGVMMSIGEVVARISGPLMRKVAEDSALLLEREARERDHLCPVVLMAIARLARLPMSLADTNKLVEEVLAHIRTDGEAHLSRDVDIGDLEDLLNALSDLLGDDDSM